jgi:hypothetical protein
VRIYFSLSVGDYFFLCTLWKSLFLSVLVSYVKPDVATTGDDDDDGVNFQSVCCIGLVVFVLVCCVDQF